MRRCRSLWILVVITVVLFFSSEKSYSEPSQLFLDPVSELVCGVPLNIEILILDNRGRVVTDISGEKNLEISVEEDGGQQEKSFSILSRNINFNNGKGIFILENSEEEVLNVNVEISDFGISGDVVLDFYKKDTSPPELVGIKADEPGIIRLEFNEILEEEAAQETRNYKAITNQREVYPESIEYHRDRVILKFEENFTNDEEGYIEMEDIKDLKGNQISSGLKSPDFKGKCPCSKQF